ncbi:hypothetical protein LSH36_24g08003 [Paralvinella palmiformis]|uniref:Uncharacterized protein n=1 Tax=Paralvinella palmiformis TaxID=53620 RepID=A0AAD9KB10_9ANNE|nr:hypothetical protein LSH36_24g08003 [Paralvinella palmiformis]
MEASDTNRNTNRGQHRQNVSSPRPEPRYERRVGDEVLEVLSEMAKQHHLDLFNDLVVDRWHAKDRKPSSSSSSSYHGASVTAAISGQNNVSTSFQPPAVCYGAMTSCNKDRERYSLGSDQGRSYEKANGVIPKKAESVSGGTIRSSGSDTRSGSGVKAKSLTPTPSMYISSYRGNTMPVGRYGNISGNDSGSRTEKSLTLGSSATVTKYGWGQNNPLGAANTFPSAGPQEMNESLLSAYSMDAYSFIWNDITNVTQGRFEDGRVGDKFSRDISRRPVPRATAAQERLIEDALKSATKVPKGRARRILGRSKSLTDMVAGSARRYGQFEDENRMIEVDRSRSLIPLNDRETCDSLLSAYSVSLESASVSDWEHMPVDRGRFLQRSDSDNHDTQRSCSLPRANHRDNDRGSDFERSLSVGNVTKSWTNVQHSLCPSSGSGISMDKDTSSSLLQAYSGGVESLYQREYFLQADMGRSSPSLCNNFPHKYNTLPHVACVGTSQENHTERCSDGQPTRSETGRHGCSIDGGPRETTFSPFDQQVTSHRPRLQFSSLGNEEKVESPVVRGTMCGEAASRLISDTGVRDDALLGQELSQSSFETANAILRNDHGQSGMTVPRSQTQQQQVNNISEEKPKNHRSLVASSAMGTAQATQDNEKPSGRCGRSEQDDLLPTHLNSAGQEAKGQLPTSGHQRLISDGEPNIGKDELRNLADSICLGDDGCEGGGGKFVLDRHDLSNTVLLKLMLRLFGKLSNNMDTMDTYMENYIKSEIEHVTEDCMREMRDIEAQMEERIQQLERRTTHMETLLRLILGDCGSASRIQKYTVSRRCRHDRANISDLRMVLPLTAAIAQVKDIIAIMGGGLILGLRVILIQIRMQNRRRLM